MVKLYFTGEAKQEYRSRYYKYDKARGLIPEQ